MSFQATEWARSLPLHSLSAKFTLMMIASYAGPEGSCWPSLSTLADDTLQSVATVRRRIREAEQLGLLSRAARWVSADGKLVVTQLGDAERPAECRQTSDELRLVLSVTPAQVRERVAAMLSTPDEESDADETGVSDCNPCRLESSPSHPGATPGVSPGSHPLNSHSETSDEKAPLPPEGGVRATRWRSDQVVEPEGFEKFWHGYPGFRVMDRAKAAVVFTQLTTEERDHASTALSRYVAELDRLKRKPIDAHKWLSKKGWKEFSASNAAGVEAQVFVPEGSDEDRLWINFQHLTGAFRAEARWSGAHGRKGTWERTLTPPWQLGLAVDRADWWFVEEGTPNFNRWIERIREHHLGRVGIRPAGIGDRNRPFITKDGNAIGSRELRGLVVPSEWPPRKTDDAAPPTGPPHAT